MFILLEDPTGKDKAIAEIEEVSKENEEILEQLKDLFHDDREMSDFACFYQQALEQLQSAHQNRLHSGWRAKQGPVDKDFCPAR